MALVANPSFSNATILVLRTENLWNDWVAANQYLGGQEVVVVPTNATRGRGYSRMNLPVSTHLSEEGRRNLCCSLVNDYKAYISLLRQASKSDR